MKQKQEDQNHIWILYEEKIWDSNLNFSITYILDYYFIK